MAGTPVRPNDDPAALVDDQVDDQADDEADDPVDAPAEAPRPRRVPLALATWALIVLVLAVVVVLLILRITHGAATVASGLTGPAVAPAPAAVVADATSVPPAVYDAVGAPATSDPPPVVLSGQPRLVLDGKPVVVFVGGEFCPYCAAERWVVVTALARFGTFSHLGATSSAANQVFAKTATFTFDGTTFTSRYVTLQSAEAYADAPSQTAPGGVPRLNQLDPIEATLLRRYGTVGPGGPVLPFVDAGNVLVASGAEIGLSPAELNGASMGTVAGNLSNPTDPATLAVVGAANELTAAICTVTGQQPGPVCASPGVRAGAARLGLG